MWHTGTIQIQGELVEYEVKAYDEPSIHGIEDGRISKLFLAVNGYIVAAYDRGWDIKPQTASAVLALAVLMKKYN